MEKRIAINDQVTVGPQPTVEEIKQLARDGFQSVINLRVQDEEKNEIPPHIEGTLVRDEDMEYVHIPISMKQILHEQIATFRQAITNLHHPIYVHCASGQRAAALAVMDEAIRRDWSGEQALEQAREMGCKCDAPGLQDFVKNYVDQERQKA
jgi:uncharacterized protein (TIGR01244 family)